MRLRLLLAVLLLAAPLPALAQSAGAQVQARINEAVAATRGIGQVDGRMVREQGRFSVATQIAPTDGSRQAEAQVTGIVIAAIAGNPATVNEVVRAGVGAAPQFRDAIVRGASAAFPGFAPAIAAAAGGGANMASAAPATAPYYSYSPAPYVVAVPSPSAAALAVSTPPRAAAPVALAAAPAARVEPVGGQESDPLEGVNRAIFAVNDVADRFVIRPIAWTYGTVAPDPVKRSMRNFFRNLGSPVRFVNDVLQFTFEDAGVTVARFGINTTVGVLGLFEVAEGWGLAHHPADFGQTLHSYGVGSGPYIVIPLLGPSTLRDGVGTAVDIFFDPLTYTLDTYPRLGVTAANAIVRREQLIEPLDDLRENSIDYYAALRSAYFQDRAVTLRKGRGGAAASAATDAAFENFD